MSNHRARAAHLPASALTVGQRVFCPRHGIGIIRERRQRQVLGHRRAPAPSTTKPSSPPAA